MRVLHVVTAFPRDEDDLVTPWLVELLKRSRRRGLDAEVLAPAYRGLDDHRLEGIPVHRFRYAPRGLETLTHEETVPDRIRRSPLHAALVAPYLAAGCVAAWREGGRRPAVVHVHWPMPHALFGAAARVGSGGRSALVCSYYAVEVNWVNRRLRWLRPFLRWTARTADAVTAISTSTARAVEEVSGRRPAVVPFAAALGPGQAGGAGGREPLSGEGALHLLFVGRLVERKGVEVAVEALDRLLPDLDARLTVVGEGAWEGRIRRVARELGVVDRVTFAGRVPDGELSKLYAECDIFVLPAVVDRKGDTEGLGVVLLEALQFERPVVASAVGGIPDIVEHGRTGWLVEPSDPAALAAEIRRRAERPEESRRVAKEGRQVVERRFAWPRILDELEDTYRRAVAAREEGA